MKHPCSCPCHVKAERDIHVSPLTRTVLWCCHAPFAQPAPMVEPQPLIRNELVELKPMDIPIGKIFDLDDKFKK